MTREPGGDGWTRRSFLGRLGLCLPAVLLGASRARAAIAKKPLPAPDLSFLDDAVPLVRRTAWAPQEARFWRLRSAGRFDRLTVHHTGSVINRHTDKSVVMQDLEGVITGHLDRNYGDIGYHFVLDYSGRVWEGRSLAYEGAHVSGQNKGNIGIVVLGNYERQQPSEEQLDSIWRLSESLRDRFGIKRHRVYGHRDLGASLCPGQYLYKRVNDIRGSAA